MKRMMLLLLTALALSGMTGWAQTDEGRSVGPVYVSDPVVPTLTPAIRDLPDFVPDPGTFGLEMKRREDWGFTPVEYPHTPRVDPLMNLQYSEARTTDTGFATLLHNYAGQSSTSSPPDTTGDVGLTYFVQATNQSVSTVAFINKTTGAFTTKTLASLASASPCNSGFCDPIVLYDRVANRWILSELPSADASVCVYVSQTSDPTGAYYAYNFAVDSSVDYPKYGVWPQNGTGGSYLVGLNASGTSGYHDLAAFDRAKMLAGLAATYQKFSVPDLANSGFQLVLPSHMEGSIAPPNGEAAIFIRPHDDEAEDGASTPTYDWLDIWALSVDWTTPANSTFTKLANIQIADYDMTLCAMGSTWNCMPQPGTTQKIDPIREPLHWPLHYRNFSDHQALVGTFVEDVDGTDHAALRWFELRKPESGGSWTLYQEGVIGGESGVHRSVGSISIDSSSNIAIGYTRTGTASPYYPSIYYRGRLASDTLGTMPQGEYSIIDGAYSKTADERWGDYSGMATDPSDDCTFWFTTEYMTSASNCGTKVAAFKFTACGCLAVPAAPSASASVPQNNRIDVTWNDSSTATITQYFVYRSTTTGGPYTKIATVADSSPGTANGAGYTYHDDTVSGGTRYYYVVQSSDGVSCISANSTEVNALATGSCMLPPTFAGITGVTNPGSSTCTLNLAWSAGTSNCSGTLTYNVYRSTTTGFTPGPANQIATGILGTTTIDGIGIVSGTVYYYVVRAVDTANSVEDSNTVQGSGSPTGPITTAGWTDTFEGALSGGGFDQAGWTHNYISGTTNWAWSTAQAHDGTHSWFAADIATVSDMVLVSPSFGVIASPSTTLSFYHYYTFESTYDGGTLEYTTNGGTTWTVVPAGDYTAGAPTVTISASFSNPIGGMLGWSGTQASWTQVVVNLGGDSNLVGKTVQIRWHEGNDSSTASTGWYVDTVVLANGGVAGTCSMGVNCTPPGAPTLASATGDCNGVNLAWSAGTGTTTAYNVYRSAAGCGTGYTKIAGPVTGTAYSDTTAVAGTPYAYIVRGTCDAGGIKESSDSNCITAARLQCPYIIYQTHGTLTQVTGDGDAYYELGEKWSVQVTLRNTGTAAATNVTATLSGNGVTFCNPTQSFGTIAAGGSGSATFEFVISTSFSPCGGAVNFNVTGKICTELSPAGSDESGVFTLNVGQVTAGSPTNLVIQPSSADTYVNQNSTGTNYGTATTMLTNVRSSREEDLLVQFDLSGIPAGSTINSATLEMYATAVPATTYAVNVMRNTATWVETSVTWTGKPAYDATYIAQITPTAAVGWKIWTVTSAVQGWSSGTNTNYGFTVKPNATSGSTNYNYTFATREYTTNTAYRPILRVNYTPPTGGWDCSYVGTGTCGCTTPTAPAIASVTDVSQCAASGVQVNFTPGTPATSNDLYKDGVLAVTGYTSGATFNPGNTSSHTYVIRTNNGTCHTDSTGSAFADANNMPGTPIITAVNDVSACATSGVQIVYTPGSGADGHDLYKDGVLAQLNYASGATYTPGDNASHTYMVRAAVAAGCYAYSTGMAGTDANNTPGAPSITGITDNNPAVQNGIHVNFNAGSPAGTSYDLYKNGSLVVSGYTSGALYNPGDTLTNTYFVRAINGGCTADSLTAPGTDAAGTPPSEAAPGDTGNSSGQNWPTPGDTSTQSWPPVSGATSYTVYRGALGDLPNLMTAATDSCTVYTGSSTSATDASSPILVPGRLYWYLVTASNGMGEGSAGNATTGARIVNSSGNCP